jgi:hypothetical protein
MGKISAIFLICLIGVVLQTSDALAQPPIEAYAPQLSIINPPSTPNRYENNSVILEVNVRLLEGSPKPSNFSYTLDGNQLNDLSNYTTNKTSYWTPYNFTSYIAKVALENLSEGNHTVTVYADGLTQSTTFRVNSYYHPTVVKILSPTNHTYSNSVPLTFTVNMPIQGAYYYMYRDYEAVFENHFSGNITLSNLLDGEYVFHLYVTTENGLDSASTSFSVSNNSASSNFILSIVPFVFGIIALMAVVGLLLYFRKKNSASKHSIR